MCYCHHTGRASHSKDTKNWGFLCEYISGAKCWIKSDKTTIKMQQKYMKKCTQADTYWQRTRTETEADSTITPSLMLPDKKHETCTFWQQVNRPNNRHTLKQKCYYFDEIFITGCPESCQMTTCDVARWNIVKMMASLLLYLLSYSS